MISVRASHKSRDVLFKIDNLDKMHNLAIRNAMYDTGKRLEKEVKSNINNVSKTGTLYKIGSRIHRASAAGESPANLSGNLKRSVDYDVRGTSQIEFGYKSLYGEFLELGTRYMKPRPNLSKASDNNQQYFIRSLVYNLKKVVK